MQTIYSIRLEMEYRNDFDDTTNYDTSFKVLDAYDYSSISTIDVKRSLFDLSVNGNGSLIALVEDQPAYEAKSETFVKIYCVGMKKTDHDEEVCDLNNDNHANNSSSTQLPNLSRLYANPGASNGGMGRTTGREGASLSLFGTTAASGNGGVGGHAAPRPRAAGGVNDVGVGNRGGEGGGGGVGGGGGDNVGGGGNANESRNGHQFAIRWHGNNVEIVPPHMMGQRPQRSLQIQPQPQSRNHHHHPQNRSQNNSNNNNNNRDAGLRAVLELDPLDRVGDGGNGGGGAAAAPDDNNDLDALIDLNDIAINLLSLLVGR